jgi:lipopolysaccharide export system protein LptC
MPFVLDRRVIVILGLLLLALLSWLLPKGLEVPEPPDTTQPRHIPDYTLNSFTATAMDGEGRVHYRIRAERMVHFMDDDTSRLERPDVIVFRGDAGAWNAHARYARVSGGQEQVLLTGGVLVWRDPEKTGTGLELQTSELLINPEQKLAETQRPVTIAQEFGVTHAVGMRVNLERSRLELLADVRGRYHLAEQ